MTFMAACGMAFGAGVIVGVALLAGVSVLCVWLFR